MIARTTFAAALALLGAWPAASWADEAPAAKQPATSTPADASTRGGEPQVQHTVIEDDATRIEELKVRGQTQRITVSPKGLKSYEILPANQGRDMSDSAGSQHGAAGKRVWHIFTF